MGILWIDVTQNTTDRRRIQTMDAAPLTGCLRCAFHTTLRRIQLSAAQRRAGLDLDGLRGRQTSLLDHERRDRANVGHVVYRRERVVADVDGLAFATAVVRLVEHDARAASVDVGVCGGREARPGHGPRDRRATLVALLGLGHGERPRLAGEDQPVERDGGRGRVRGWRVHEVRAGQEVGRLGRQGCPAEAADGLEAADAAAGSTSVVTQRRDAGLQIAKRHLCRAVGRRRRGRSRRVEHVGAVEELRGLGRVRVLAVAADGVHTAEPAIDAAGVRHNIDAVASISRRGTGRTGGWACRGCWRGAGERMAQRRAGREAQRLHGVPDAAVAAVGVGHTALALVGHAHCVARWVVEHLDADLLVAGVDGAGGPVDVHECVGCLQSKGRSCRQSEELGHGAGEHRCLLGLFVVETANGGMMTFQLGSLAPN